MQCQAHAFFPVPRLRSWESWRASPPHDTDSVRRADNKSSSVVSKPSRPRRWPPPRPVIGGPAATCVACSELKPSDKRCCKGSQDAVNVIHTTRMYLVPCRSEAY
ncbi:hypothetical protein EJ04DRAFT_508720 [Polyplosphaeria fusca]|uniref:Uncharacterized protein n=1 Tax=Polyplosphaeria fusca TaxID=682080 RepID=A0A9P4R9X3_9PLEO|nr:hypothetical protein EJ04DRAFT_508720 [Polyplosphaeria fusca]